MTDKPSDPGVGAGGILSSGAGPSSSKIPEGIGAVTEIYAVFLERVSGQQFPANPNKSSEYGDDSRCPLMGYIQDPESAIPRSLGLNHYV